MTEVFIHGLVRCHLNGKKRANRPQTHARAHERALARAHAAAVNGLASRRPGPTPDLSHTDADFLFPACRGGDSLMAFASSWRLLIGREEQAGSADASAARHLQPASAAL